MAIGFFKLLLGHGQSASKRVWVNTLNSITLLKMGLKIQFGGKCDRLNRCWVQAQKVFTQLQLNRKGCTNFTFIVWFLQIKCSGSMWIDALNIKFEIWDLYHTSWTPNQILDHVQHYGFRLLSVIQSSQQDAQTATRLKLGKSEERSVQGLSILILSPYC